MGDQVLIRCHCGQFAETTQLQGSIPVDNIVCHCNICRRTTGALTFTGLGLASPPVEAFETKLTKYASSEQLSRYFCNTCGSHVGYHVVKENRWSVCSGAVDQVIGDKKGRLEKITSHEFVGDTKDGGLLPCFPRTTVYMEHDGVDPVSDWRKEMTLHGEKTTEQSANTLRAACHCGKVSFSLSRPEESDHHSQWEAGVCVCRSCRLSFGQSLVTWAFNIPFAKVHWSDGTEHHGELHESLRRFQSSDHAHRDFCKTCGASVFYFSSRQQGLMDIAFGLLRAEDGALAKSWFKWRTHKICYPEDAVDEDLVKIVQESFRLIQDQQ